MVNLNNVNALQEKKNKNCGLLVVYFLEVNHVSSGKPEH